MTNKDIIKHRQEAILEQIRAFAAAKLNDEYFELAEKMLLKLSRKRNVPFATGKIEIWAAAIIHALGMVNFLFDSSQEPHATVNEINGFFATNQSTVTQKSKLIRDLLKLHHYDPDFSTQERLENNPFRYLAMINGLICNIK